MRYPRTYKKDLEHLTTIRLSKSMREEAEKKADYLGISFSDFVRQAINRSIFVSTKIEDEVVRRTAELAIGRSL